MATTHPTKLQAYIFDWCKSATPLLHDSSVQFAESLELSPIDRTARRRTMPGAEWAVLEQNGEFFVLIGFRHRVSGGFPGFDTFELNAQKGESWGFWMRHGAGVWEFVAGGASPIREP